MRSATYELNNKKKIIQAHFCKQDIFKFQKFHKNLMKFEFSKIKFRKIKKIFRKSNSLKC